MSKFSESTTEPDVEAVSGLQREFTQLSVVKAPKGWVADGNVVPLPSVITKAALGHLEVGRVNTSTELKALESEWRALEARLPALPFVSFDWNVAWWQHMSERKLTLVDKLAVRTFRSSSGELCAVAPLMLTRRPGVGPMQFRQMQFFGADPNMTEIRGIAVPDDLRQQVYLALLDDLHSESNTWDSLHLAGLPCSSSIEADVEQRFPGANWLPDLPDYYLRLPTTWCEFKSGLSRNIKESLRKCYNAPRRDGVSFSLAVVRATSEVTDGVESFLCLHQARAERSETIHHNNVFATECTRNFLFDVCHRFAARDALRIFQLKIAGQVVATRIGFVHGKALYLYFSGYSPAYAQYSIMTTLVAEIIQYAISEGIHSVNLSTGTDVSKQRWSPASNVYRSATLVSPSLRGHLTSRTYGATRNAIRSWPGALRMCGLLSRRS